MVSSEQSKRVFSGQRARWAMVISVFLLAALCVPAIGQAWGPGDADGDGDVDLDDFVILKTNSGATYTYADELDLDCGDGVTLTLVRLRAGTFMMGSPTGEVDRDSDEGPQHQVTISQDFYMGVYEVTQRQYQAVMGTNPSYFKSSGPDAPVECVSWNNAVAFCPTFSRIARSCQFMIRAFYSVPAARPRA